MNRLVQIDMTAEQLAPFVKKFYAPTKTWKEGRLVEYLKWYIAHGFCFVVRENKKPRALVLARPLKNPEDITEYYLYDKNGHYLSLDLIIVLKPGYWPYVVGMLIDRFRWKTHIIFKRKFGKKEEINETAMLCKKMRRIFEKAFRVIG